MTQSYTRLLRDDPEAPWASGFLCIGEGGATRPLHLGTRISTRLRYLPASELAQAMLNGLGSAIPGTKAVVEARLRPRLIELPRDAVSSLVMRLREGRLPKPGKDEVIAGSQAPAEDHLSVAGRTLKVVGVLQPCVALLADSYLLPKHGSSDAFFPAGESEVRPVEIFDLEGASFSKREILAQVTDAFPGDSFIVQAPEVRSNPRGFALYLSGQALFLLGGTGLLIGLYRWLSSRMTWAVLAGPLHELAHRPRLIWGVHLVYFGLFVLGALVISQLPALNSVLMAATQGAPAQQRERRAGYRGSCLRQRQHDLRGPGDVCRQLLPGLSGDDYSSVVDHPGLRCIARRIPRHFMGTSASAIASNHRLCDDGAQRYAFA